MTNATNTPHHPSHSAFFPDILKNDNGTAPRYLCPIVNSIIKIRIPEVHNANKYGIKNAPPPLSYATYGNLHIFPSPTAEPTAAIIKPALVPHCERCSIPFTSPSTLFD